MLKRMAGLVVVHTAHPQRHDLRVGVGADKALECLGQRLLRLLLELALRPHPRRALPAYHP